jgi:ribosomal protein S18 acetylase RimI-like enzyme
MALSIVTLDPEHADARVLLDELSAALQAITGDSGRSGFVADDVRGPRSRFVVARDADGHAIGCGALRPLQDGVAELKRMYAKTDGRGTGAAVLAHLEAAARELGYRAVWLETRAVNTRAVAFYERHGYRRIDNFGRYAGNAAALCFGKELGMTTSTIRELDGAEALARVAELAEVLRDCVEGGASVGFMLPLAEGRPEAFWRKVAASVAAGERHLFVAEDETGRICGTLSLVVDMPDNQPHRADVSKMLVHRRARRQGMAERLLKAMEAKARELGKTTLVLDTVTGSDASRVYERLGWQKAGDIPNYALMPNGALCSTTYYFLHL